MEIILSKPKQLLNIFKTLVVNMSDFVAEKRKYILISIAEKSWIITPFAVEKKFADGRHRF